MFESNKHSKSQIEDKPQNSAKDYVRTSDEVNPFFILAKTWTGRFGNEWKILNEIGILNSGCKVIYSQIYH